MGILLLITCHAHAAPYAVLPLTSTKQLRIDLSEGTATYQFAAMDRDFIVDVEPNPIVDNLPAGQRRALDGQLPLLLRGTVRGEPASWARLTVDGELVTGMLGIDDRLYRLSNSQQLGLPAQTATVLVEAGKSSVLRSSPDVSTSTASIDKILFPPLESTHGSSRPRFGTDDFTRLFGARADTDTGKAVRVGIVLDSQYHEINPGTGMSNALNIMNIVDGIYQDQLNVTLRVDRILSFDRDDTDPLRSITGTIENQLFNFRDFRLDSADLPSSLGLVHWFSGKSNPEQVIGLGWIDTICRNDGYDVSMSTPFPYADLLVAHEIAHNLGAVHDDSTACSSNRTALMWPIISRATRDAFSSCSVDAMQPGINAACNLDVVDLELELIDQAALADGQTELTLQVYNPHLARTIWSATFIVDMPEQVAVSQYPSGCQNWGSRLQCDLQPIAASDAFRFTLQLTNNVTTTSPVYLSLNSNDVHDPNSANSQFSVVLPGAPASAPLDDALTEHEQLDEFNNAAGDAQANGNVITGGGGSWSPTMLVLLLLYWQLRMPLNRIGRKRTQRIPIV